MIVFRLSKSKFADDLSGKGAEKCGGRWNGKGVAMVYTSESRALCTTEIAVHTPLGALPQDYKIISIEIPDEIEIKELAIDDLPADWSSFPHQHSTQLIGDEFIAKNEFLVLKVPSVVVKGDFNYLINPGHIEINRVKIKSIESFSFDVRLFK